MNDQEIFDSIGVPEERRAELQRMLHAWSRSGLPGPNMYAVQAILFWRMMNNPPLWPTADMFDPTDWGVTP